MTEDKMNQRVWVSKWALTYGIFEIEADPIGLWVAFNHPWTSKDVAAGPGDWHIDRWGALRQANKKRHSEMQLLLDRLGVLNKLNIQEYELSDYTRLGKPLREPSSDVLMVKRALSRSGMKGNWGDSDLPPKISLVE